MAQQLNDQWGTDSGLVTEFDGDCVEAWFGTNEQSEFNPDRVFLWLKFVNITTPDDEHLDEITQRLSIGNGWEIADGGKRVVRADGNERKGFNENTALGKLSDRVTGQKKEGEKYGEGFKDLLAKFAETGASPRDAEIWTGHRFHVGKDEYPIKDRETGEMTTYPVVMPQAYLGPAKVSGGNATPTPATTETTTNGNGTNDTVLLATLRNLAKEKSSHQEFLDDALNIDGVATNQEILNQVADDSDAGLYAQANA